jgi:hypothetical protein
MGCRRNGDKDCLGNLVTSPWPPGLALGSYQQTIFSSPASNKRLGGEITIYNIFTARFKNLDRLWVIVNYTTLEQAGGSRHIGQRARFQRTS